MVFLFFTLAHIDRGYGRLADCGRFPVKPKDNLGGKMPIEKHRCRTCG